MSRAYYNENDKYAAQWLLNLIDAGLIAAGDVDDRSIMEVTPADVRGYTQAHFFAGIGGWSLALRLAGWPDDCPVWTGSCPCQPFSRAGKQQGFCDPRHLWPVWFGLIEELRPATILGEQVAGAGAWLDLAFSDLESVDYACAAVDMPAASVGAPHNRARLWFLSHTESGWRQSRSRLREIRAEQDRTKLANYSWWNAEPDVARVADGIPGLVDQRRSFGNAIVPQVAAEFIKAAMAA